MLRISAVGDIKKQVIPSVLAWKKAVIHFSEMHELLQSLPVVFTYFWKAFSLKFFVPGAQPIELQKICFVVLHYG